MSYLAYGALVLFNLRGERRYCASSWLIHLGSGFEGCGSSVLLGSVRRGPEWGSVFQFYSQHLLRVRSTCAQLTGGLGSL